MYYILYVHSYHYIFIFLLFFYITIRGMIIDTIYCRKYYQYY